MYDDPTKPEHNWARIGVIVFLMLGVIWGLGRFMGWWRLSFIIGAYVWTGLMGLAVGAPRRTGTGSWKRKMRPGAVVILVIVGLVWILYWSSGLNQGFLGRDPIPYMGGF